MLGTQPKSSALLQTSSSIVILGIGQYGVTLAHEFFMRIPNNPSLYPSFFFQKEKSTLSDPTKQSIPLWIPRCVLLDTEPKVLQMVLQQSKQKEWRYHPKCVHWRKTGAANNWAYGYHLHGASMYALIRKAIQYQVAQCGSSFGGFILLHSLAGGTGSGLGSFVTEQLRKEYPNAILFNQVIWPFSNGEVIVQHYNIILTLYRLIKNSNMILLLFNDHLQQICEARLGKLPATFNDLNQFIALILFHLLSPCIEPCTRKFSSLSSIVRLMVSSPHVNLVTVYLVPQVPAHVIPYSTFTWHMLLRSLYRMVVSHVPTDESTNSTGLSHVHHPPSLYSLLLLLKYEKTIFSSLDLREKEMLQSFSHPSRFVHRKVRVGLFNGKGTGVPGITQLAVALCNSTAIYSSLEHSFKSAIEMYKVGAFLHPYKRFGMTHLDFDECFQFMYQIGFQCIYPCTFVYPSISSFGFTLI